MTTIQVLAQTQVIRATPVAQTIIVNPLTGVAIVVNPSTPAISVINAGPQGPVGASGSGGSAGFNHTQGSAGTVWTINHNLGFKPSVQTFNTGGLEVIGEVQHTTNNQTTVTFNTAVSGTARLI